MTRRRSRYAFKDYLFPSGRSVKIQGLEDVYLDILLKEFQETDILVCEETPYYVPYFWYGKTRKYLPDFFVPSQNLFIEVKSKYTYHRKNSFVRKTQAKLEACRNLGYDTRLVVFEGRSSKKILLYEEKAGKDRL